MRKILSVLTISIVLLFALSAMVYAKSFYWPMFVPATTGAGLQCDSQNLSFCRKESDCLNVGGYWFNNKCNDFSCTDIVKCYSGSFTDNCPGYNVSGTMGVSLNENCTFSAVSIFGEKISGTITGRQNNTFTGTGQTDANGCGAFSITCTDYGSSLSCNYQYSNGKVGSISNAVSIQCVPANKFLTQSLSGSWNYVYWITSVFTNNYYLNGNDVSESSITPGEYNIFGVDDYNSMIIAGYNPTTNDYMLLDAGTMIDRVFFFTYTNANQVSGCYYQIDNSTGEWSSCYSMNGDRFSTSSASSTSSALSNANSESMEMSSEAEQVLLNEVRADQTNKPPVDPVIIEQYESLKNRLEDKIK